MTTTKNIRYIAGTLLIKATRPGEGNRTPVTSRNSFAHWLMYTGFVTKRIRTIKPEPVHKWTIGERRPNSNHVDRTLQALAEWKRDMEQDAQERIVQIVDRDPPAE